MTLGMHVCTLDMLFGNVPTEQLMRMVLGAVIRRQLSAKVVYRRQSSGRCLTLVLSAYFKMYSLFVQWNELRFVVSLPASTQV